MFGSLLNCKVLVGHCLLSLDHHLFDDSLALCNKSQSLNCDLEISVKHSQFSLAVVMAESMLQMTFYVAWDG